MRQCDYRSDSAAPNLLSERASDPCQVGLCGFKRPDSQMQDGQLYRVNTYIMKCFQLPGPPAVPDLKAFHKRVRIPYPSGLSINWVDFAVLLEFFDLTEVRPGVRGSHCDAKASTRRVGHGIAYGMRAAQWRR